MSRHWNDGHHEISDCLVDDEDCEVGAQFLLVLVRQQNEQVRRGADGGEDEQKCGDDDDEDADVAAARRTGNSRDSREV